MNSQNIALKPLYADVNREVERPQPVYFFQRENGTVFHASEKDAWTLLKGRVQHVGAQKERLVFIGKSDGTKFQEAVFKSQEAFREKGLAAAQEIIRAGIAAELEFARTNKVLPPNQDTLDQRGNPTNISLLR